MNEFLSTFFFDDKGKMGLAVGFFANSRLLSSADVRTPTDKDVWFTPALLKEGTEPDKITKDAVLGSVALWCDVDNDKLPLSILPPSIIVASGMGWHLYWLLKEPVRDVATIERYNRFLFADIVTADTSTWNANRWMRVPDSVNTKYETRPTVKLHKYEPALRYDLNAFAVVAQLDPNLMNRIRTGSERGYKSRSERDWAVIVDLTKAGADYELCEFIFNVHKIGDKARSEPSYFKHTWDAVQTKHGRSVATTKGKGAAKRAEDATAITLFEREDGMYRGSKRVSTFSFTPKLLLDAYIDNAEDALVGDVTANGYTWEGVTFVRSAFNEIRRMDRECRMAAWQWLGNENELRAWLPSLLETLRANGLPRVSARSSLGLYEHKGRWFFIGDKGTLGSQDYWPNFTGPLHWVPNKREHPEMDLEVAEPSSDVRTLLTRVLPDINDAEVFWPMLGWYVSSTIKPWLEQNGRRFPILNVTGTRGSGKTTTILRCFMPLLGHTAPKAFDAGTTRFVTLALMGSSNAVPVCFSEFRYESVAQFIRFILLSYDTGHDPRGKADQTTVDYPLSAPFSIDGEDLITDPAAQERIVVAQFKPASIAEKTNAHTIWKRIRPLIPQRFGGWFVQQLLGMLDSKEMERMHGRAEQEVFDYFPGIMPDRVRSNHIVSWLGVLLWCRILETEPPSMSCLIRSINNVCNLGVGRSRTLSDEFIESVVAEVSRRSMTQFKWCTNDDGTVLYVQITPAYNWWLTLRRRQGKGALDLSAVKNQILESPYYAGTITSSSALLYGIKLGVANNLGLDVVGKLDAATELTITF